MLTTRLTFMRYKQMRWYSKAKMIVVDTLNESLSKNDIQHKSHPGLVKPRQIEQPNWLTDTIRMIIHDEKISPKRIHATGEKLTVHLKGRHLPPETEVLKAKLQQVQEKFATDKIQALSQKELLKNPQARKYFKTLVHNWTPIQYDRYTCLTYLVGRSIVEYSILYKIFSQIANDDKNFIPKTLFDYGSGVGTVMWAASQFWVDSIKEYYCVDISKDMIELSEFLIKRAEPKIKPSHIFYRQFFPASPIPTYDIVVSAYSLFELPNQKSRLEIISKLWRKTEQYLIIIEQGTNAGFSIINEARDFLLNYQGDAQKAHVFLPCPHDLKCPRYVEGKTPCNFNIHYLTLPIGNNSKYKTEMYSYVVLKRAERPENDCNWPRIVRPVLKRSRHVICRMCTASGQLQEQIFSKYKNGRHTYRCARCSKWGDRLPFKLEEIEESQESGSESESEWESESESELESEWESESE